MSEQLLKAVDAVLALEPRLRPYTWPAAGGGALTQDGFQTEWGRRMDRYVEQGGVRFHEHDLRAEAVAGLGIQHAQMLLGHQTDRVTRLHYQRRPMRVKPAK